MNDIYTPLSYKFSRQLTLHYSSSFGISSRLFSRTIRPHIFAIYGLVRIADEVVDTYRGSNARELLDQLEAETYGALISGYSTNPIVHAYALTAREYGISKDLIESFFASMRMDTPPNTYTSADYASYIYGSAEVIGLMCLHVFSGENTSQYSQLQGGAKALGAAYQKVNFLRDIAADHQELHRMYFPGMTFENFNEEAKQHIIAEIQADFKVAETAIAQLPPSSRTAVRVSYRYYTKLLVRLEKTPAESIKTTRIRIPTITKLRLLVATLVREGIKR